MNSATDDDDSASKDRLDNLSAFQQSILQHALSFPKVKKVVYSTCSTHVEENEFVVNRVLEQVRAKFELSELMPGFPGRGKATFAGGEHCVSLNPERDLTNGFFVACFVRMASSEQTNAEITLKSNEERIGAKPAVKSEYNNNMKKKGKSKSVSTVKQENYNFRSKKLKLNKETNQSECEMSHSEPRDTYPASGGVSMMINKRKGTDTIRNTGLVKTEKKSRNKNKKKRSKYHRVKPVTV